MNKEGMAMTADIPRKNFFHWVLVDIPPSVTSIKEGAEFELPASCTASRRRRLRLV